MLRVVAAGRGLFEAWSNDRWRLAAGSRRSNMAQRLIARQLESVYDNTTQKKKKKVEIEFIHWASFQLGIL
jgi:hypothetical protein